MNSLRTLLVLIAVAVFLSVPAESNAQGFGGSWKLDMTKSRNADFFDGESVALTITSESGSRMRLAQVVKTEYDTRTTVMNLDFNGPATRSVWPKGDIPLFGYEAVAIGNDRDVTVKAEQGGDRSAFDVTLNLTVTVSQGLANVVVRSHYQLSPDGNTLTVTSTRDSRESGEPVVYVFRKAD